MTTPFIHRIPGELDQAQAQKLAERHAGNPFIQSAGWGAVQYALDIIGKEFGLKPSNTDLIVEQHILCNVSVLVATLSGSDYEHGADSLGSLMDRAEAIADGIPQYEAAARAAGWSVGSQIHRIEDEEIIVAESWKDACEQDDLEPDEIEIKQHWAVTPWLANKLISMGETVDRRFAGLSVWARTEANGLINEDKIIVAIAEAGSPPEAPTKG